MIADLDYRPPLDLVGASERAIQEIAYTEGAGGEHLGALGRFLIATESVSSSKIERVVAGVADFAKALGGIKSNPSAVSMVAATDALTELVDEAGRTGRIELAAVLSAHHTLMMSDPLDGDWAGRIREEQNWIGGSDFSPRNAIHVPPPHELVKGYLDDLIAYVNRDDIPVFVQAAIAHAQFESIHPFTDGNGRIGRAIIHAILRRRGVTRQTVVPVATAMVADRDRYFAHVNAYRAGDVAPFVAALARGAELAAIEARATAARFAELPDAWRDRVRQRSGSVAHDIIDGLLERPVLTGDTASTMTSAHESRVFPALDLLVESDVLTELTGRKRNRVWAATEVTAELDDLTGRIETAVRDDQ
ncbi:Fic family protein [Schumannella sp. 10F1B-5-1]|uniref:Fic family protein n=1 Tax=Schumannella sp. 10F1B-5-1 TaxID=2590780 RepID=UPI0021020515|nr:Fic family protein [Schumannella sp. 10F1B-5-1]